MLFRRKKYDYEELAQRLSDLLVTPATPSDRHRKILQFLCDVLGTPGGALVLKTDGQYSVRQCLGWENFSFRMEACQRFMEWLCENRGSMTRRQLLEEREYGIVKRMGLNFFIQFQAEAVLPLYIGKELFGFITLSHKRDQTPFGAECRRLLDWIGIQVVTALENGFLKESVREHRFESESVKELKSQIISNMSHELKTPLTGVIGFAELLSEEVDGTLNAEQKRHIRHVLEGSNRLLKILSALVELAKLEAGEQSLNVGQFHLAPLVASLTEEISLGSGTVLSAHLGNGTPRIYGDLNMVRQIFKHLLDNAAKYTHQGKIEVTADKKGDVLEICVADTGIGISEGKIHKIFEDFYQGDGSITRPFEGSGIGLSVSRKLVHLHGGKLWVKSHPGKGSQFYFTLPLKPIVIKHRELAA